LSLRRFVPEDKLWRSVKSGPARLDYHMNGPASSYMAALQGYLGALS
jgi:hypothetical protein